MLNWMEDRCNPEGLRERVNTAFTSMKSILPS
jgi:hypothetical protein